MQNDTFSATIEYGVEGKPDLETVNLKIFQAISEPGTTFWVDEWWVICTSKEYAQPQYYPEHRPTWMSKGEWDELITTIKNYRLATALTEKPLLMSDEYWSLIMEIKDRHGLLPDTNPKLTMDEIEKELDEAMNKAFTKFEHFVIWGRPA